MARFESQNWVFCQINDSCFRIERESVKEATNRIYKVGDKYILSGLKELCRNFGLEWNFASTRSGKTISCNRGSRKTSYVGSGIRKSSSSMCSCSIFVCFRNVE